MLEFVTNYPAIAVLLIVALFAVLIWVEIIDDKWR
jgi:hypothetical protein